jgi:sulfur-oxidizing protein SoxZ
MATVRISIPSRAKPGDIIEIKTLITHPMETGFRRDTMGEAIPRNILTSFECRYRDRRVFATRFHPGVAANPYLSFFVRADASGTVVFTWTDQQGVEIVETRELVVAS